MTKPLKPPTPTQRATRAIVRVGETVSRNNTKLLAAAIAEIAADEVARNPQFERAIQERYDQLAETARPATRRSGAQSPYKDLVPVDAPGTLSYGPDGDLDAYGLQQLYGNHQLRDALERYTLASLKQMAQTVQDRNPGTAPENKRTKAALIDYIVLCLTGKK
jgi:hypothetical protein